MKSAFQTHTVGNAVERGPTLASPLLHRILQENMPGPASQSQRTLQHTPKAAAVFANAASELVRNQQGSLNLGKLLEGRLTLGEGAATVGIAITLSTPIIIKLSELIAGAVIPTPSSSPFPPLPPIRADEIALVSVAAGVLFAYLTALSVWLGEKASARQERREARRNEGEMIKISLKRGTR